MSTKNLAPNLAPNLFIGLMSGTSLDGVEAVLVNLNDELETACDVLAHQHLAYEESLRKLLLHSCETEDLNIKDFLLADRGVAQTSIACIEQLLAQVTINPTELKAIGSHGQTIRHIPPNANTLDQSSALGYSLQIGDPNFIAAGTGLTTVADFRRKNMALGGQGAPLAPAFHQAFFSAQTPRAIVNIGGMANISIVKPNSPVIGFDTGPGNVLLDTWVQRHKNTPYDASGTWARTGTVHTALLQKLLNHNFFAKTAPKSTGREQFNTQWLDAQLEEFETIKTSDVQASLCELSAQTIAQEITQQLPTASVYICGGGAYNDYLMERLAANLNGFTVQSTSVLGMKPELVECCGFAWLAKKNIEHEAIDLSSFAGGEKAAILGGVYFV